MASEDVKPSESAVSTIVNLAGEAKLAREGVVKAPSLAVLSVCKSLLAGGVAGGVWVLVFSELSSLHFHGNEAPWNKISHKILIFDFLQNSFNEQLIVFNDFLCFCKLIFSMLLKGNKLERLNLLEFGCSRRLEYEIRNSVKQRSQ